MIKGRLYSNRKIYRKGTDMKRVYEAPFCEEMLILTESVMTDSGEEPEEEIVDNEQNDNTVSIFSLLNR